MRLLEPSEVFAKTASLQIDTDNIRKDLLAHGKCGPPLRVYLALTGGVIGTELSALDRFYNRYYWFLRFAEAYRSIYGFDAGIDQQAFQILKNAGDDVDLYDIERIEQAVRIGDSA